MKYEHLTVGIILAILLAIVGATAVAGAGMQVRQAAPVEGGHFLGRVTSWLTGMAAIVLAGPGDAAGNVSGNGASRNAAEDITLGNEGGRHWAQRPCLAGRMVWAGARMSWAGRRG